MIRLLGGLLVLLLILFAFSGRMLALSGAKNMQGHSPTGIETESSDPLVPQPLQIAANLRNPFQPPSKPSSPKAKTPAIADTAKPITLPIIAPPFHLNAILPGPRPLAILQLRSETQIVSVGQEIWEAKIVSIGSDTVKVIYRGHEHSLTRP